MPHGHHGGGGFHHGGGHHHHHHGGYDHHRYTRERRMGLPLFGLPLLGLPLLGGLWGPRYYYGPRHRRSGCSIFALLFGILILFAFIRFWWLLIPLAILAVLGIVYLLRSLAGRPAGPGANYPPYQANQPYNQPYQANQPYQQGYSAPPPPPGYQPYQQPYPPQSGWGQYDMPQAQYPQNMPPMP